MNLLTDLQEEQDRELAEMTARLTRMVSAHYTPRTASVQVTVYYIILSLSLSLSLSQSLSLSMQ